MGTLIRDLRYAARSLRHTPLFTLGIVATLGLGIGVNAAIFGVVDRLFLRPPAGVHGADRVVRLYVRRTDPFFGINTHGIGLYPAFVDIRDGHAFAHASAVTTRDMSLGRGADAASVNVGAVSWDYFATVGAGPELGRLFVAGDDDPGAARTVVLTDAFWRAHYGANPGIVGRSILVGTGPALVVGVAARGFRGIDLTPLDMFMPIGAVAAEARLTRQDPGFDPAHLVVAEVQLPATSYPTPASDVEYARRALESVGLVPGVTATAVGTGIPLSGGAFASVERSRPDGRTDSFVFYIAAVSADYFRALGIPLVRGRALADADRDAIVIDGAAAQAFFEGQDPIGKSYPVWGKARTVVSVVGNVRQELQEPIAAHVYLPFGEAPSGYVKVLAAVSGDPARSTAVVRDRLRDLDRDVPVAKVEPMASLMAESLARERFYSALLLSFAVMALVLAAVGVYGLASYGVSRRTREFGVRIALGAGRASVLRMVVGRTLGLALLGSMLGLAGALAVTRTLKALLFEVAPDDPTAMVSAGAVLFLVTMAATYFPARRATKVDPVEALRSE